MARGRWCSRTWVARVEKDRGGKLSYGLATRIGTIKWKCDCDVNSIDPSVDVAAGAHAGQVGTDRRLVPDDGVVKAGWR